MSYHRQLKLYTKLLHVSHRENGSFEVLSLHSQGRFNKTATVHPFTWTSPGPQTGDEQGREEQRSACHKHTLARPGRRRQALLKSPTTRPTRCSAGPDFEHQVQCNQSRVFQHTRCSCGETSCRGWIVHNVVAVDTRPEHARQSTAQHAYVLSHATKLVYVGSVLVHKTAQRWNSEMRTCSAITRHGPAMDDSTLFGLWRLEPGFQHKIDSRACLRTKSPATPSSW